MKILLENWRKYIKQEVEKFLPHGTVHNVKMIGSSKLSSEEQEQQDIDKYGYIQSYRDIDVEVQISDITSEEAEEWAFSDASQRLEDESNYDVQLRIVDNWREFLNEEEELYHGTSDLYKQDILENGIQAPSYWGTAEIAAYYAKEVAEEYGGKPLIIKIPLSEFDQSLLEPDHNSIAEPLTHILGKSDEDVGEEWEEVPEPGTWRDSLDIVESVIYNATVKVLEKDLQ